MAIEKLDRDHCTNCGKCYDVCPMDVFQKMGVNVYIAFLEDCMSCHLCEDECPEEALYVSATRAGQVPMPF